MAGWRLRGYVVEELLGRGASSEVWRARVAANGDRVALKRLFLTDAGQVRRAHAEAALLTVLDHPNLVRLHALVPTPDAAVLVLDLADGGSLADLIAARGRLTPGEVITAVAPVAAALAHVHSHGVVHGDISPANLLFAPNGVSLLADLGVARLTGDDVAAESTPSCIDPAVAAGCVPTAISDVFMLGAVTLHALTGQPLWSGKSAAAQLAAARAADVSGIPERLAAARVPAAMAKVVVRALTVEPGRRCSAADFALDLRHSGTPVAVEFGAGRSRRRSVDEPARPRRKVVYDPRHAAPTGGSGGSAGSAHVVPARPVERVPPRGHSAPSGPPSWRAPLVPAGVAQAVAVSTDALPLSSRQPVPSVPSVPSAQPPTVAVRRVRPVIPRPPERRVTRRHVLAGVLALLVVAVAVAFVVTRSAPRATPRRNVAATVDWIAALRTIDAARADAFAARDATRLDQIYSSTRLRDADTALLRRLVPVGCSLRGVVTEFEQPRVTPGQRHATVRARSSIPVSTLRCAGRPDRPVAAVPAASVRIELVTTRAGVRIADLRSL